MTRQRAELTLIDLVELLYNRCQHFQVTLTPAEAAEFARRVGPWQPEQYGMLPVIEAADRIIPRKSYGPDNPNHGRTFHTYRVGREYSAVLYVDILSTYLAPGVTAAELGQRIIEEAQAAARADEAYTLPLFQEDPDGDSIAVRFWWD